MKWLTPYGVLFGLILSTPTAHAYEFLLSEQDQPLVWTATSVKYFVDSEVPELLRAKVRAGFDTWNQVIEPSLRLQYSGLHSQNARDGSSTTHLLTDWDVMYGEEGRTVAHTRIVYDVQTGTITEADILLNGAGFTFDGRPGSFDLASVVVHFHMACKTQSQWQLLLAADISMSHPVVSASPARDSHV